MTEEKRLCHIGFRCPDSLKEALQARAAAEGVKLSGLCMTIAERYLASQELTGKHRSTVSHHLRTGLREIALAVALETIDDKDQAIQFYESRRQEWLKNLGGTA